MAINPYVPPAFRAPAGPPPPTGPTAATPYGLGNLRRGVMDRLQTTRPVLAAGLQRAGDWFKNLTPDQRGYLAAAMGGYDSTRPNPTQGMFEGGQAFLASRPGPGDPFTLGPQDIRYDATGNEIARNPYEQTPLATATASAGESGTPWATTFGQEMARADKEQYDAANDALGVLEVNAIGRELLDAGVITGPTANFVTTFGSLLNDAGFSVVSDDAIANTRAYTALLGRNVGNLVTLFGTGQSITEADKEFASAMAGGEITLTEDSIRRILDINDRISQEAIEKWNQRAAAIEGAPGYADEPIVPYPLTIDIPQQEFAPPPAPLPPDAQAYYNREAREWGYRIGDGPLHRWDADSGRYRPFDPSTGNWLD